MKRILSIQDLSCLGKCSLTVALPVLSVMGCACTPLPTAVLSSHTGFPAPYVRDLTEDMEPTLRHWLSVGARFDLINVGYLSDPRQAQAVETVLDTFDALKIVDPAMGDHGKLYSGLTDQHVTAMAQLCRKGNVLLPNVTEAALLTGVPYEEQAEEGYYWELLESVAGFGTDAVILTGVSLEPGQTGYIGFNGDTHFKHQAPQVPRQCHGTGDLFTAVFTGGLARGYSVDDAAYLAARFVEQVLQATPEVTPFGVELETQLPWLWEHM